jgi:uncharacterized protein with von Willebrand factor type A (vWA) domain
MSVIEIASLVASLVAVGIGILAIWLSVVFYKISSQLSESTKEAAKGIGASVDRLEKVFDRLYSDTFSMMRDTVSDMRKHIWPEGTKADDKIAEETEKKADKKVEALKREIDSEVAKLLKKQSVTDARVSSITEELRELVARAITESRKAEIEAREESVRGHIIGELRLLRSRTPCVLAHKLLRTASERFGFNPETVLRELVKMKRDGIIHWEGKNLEPDTEISLR